MTTYLQIIKLLTGTNAYHMFILIVAVCPIEGMQQRHNSSLSIDSSIMLVEKLVQPVNFFKHNPNLPPVDLGSISGSE